MPPHTYLLDFDKLVQLWQLFEVFDFGKQNLNLYNIVALLCSFAIKSYQKVEVSLLRFSI